MTIVEEAIPFSYPARSPRPLAERPMARPAGGMRMVRSDGQTVHVTVSVVIPALNEAPNLPHVFATLPAALHEVIVVDGGSEDDTVAVTRRLRPKAKIVHQVGRGKGAALAQGAAAATGEIVVMMDADGSTAGEEIPAFVQALVDGADFVKGSRFMPGGGSSDITLARRLGNWMLSRSVNALFGTAYTDLCYGYNAFWRRCLDQVNIDCPGFEVETLMNIRAARAGLVVGEVPSFEADRIHGESNLRTFRDGLRVLRTIFRERRAAGLLGGARARPVLEAPAVPEPIPLRRKAPTAQDVSVVICAFTERRWADLQAAVGSAQRQRPGEVLVVIDHHPDLLARAEAAFPQATVIANRYDQGLSGARNTAVDLARFPVTAYLDDDAVAPPGWLDRLVEPYRDHRVAAVGGGAAPRWPGRRPRWFPTEFDWVIGCSYRGLRADEGPVRNLLGCNMSFRTDLLRRHGGFTSAVGRVGSRPLGCEETELCIRVRQDDPDAVVLYDPNVVVGHRVTRERASWSYFLNRCWSEGQSKAAVHRLVGPADALASERAYTARVLPSGLVRGMGDVARRRDVTGFARASAILLGLTATSAGYFSTRLTDGDRP